MQAVERHGLDGPVARWRALREEIHIEVCERGYGSQRGTFTQFYGSQGLDAALRASAGTAETSIDASDRFPSWDLFRSVAA